MVYDALILPYELKKANDDRLAPVGRLFDRSDDGFALPQDSPRRTRINQALLTLHERGVTDDLREKHFGGEESDRLPGAGRKRRPPETLSDAATASTRR